MRPIFKYLLSVLCAIISIMVTNPPEIITSNIGKWLEFSGFSNIPTWVHSNLFHIFLWMFLVTGIISPIFPKVKKLLMKSKIWEAKEKGTYNWDRFNSSLEGLNKLIERNVLIVDNSIKKLNCNNIFERLIKKKEIKFSTNYAGYKLLTQYELPHHLLLELLSVDKLNGVYYMRFIADSVNNPEFENLLYNPKCKFSPLAPL
jgi:hypothetical protein